MRRVIQVGTIAATLLLAGCMHSELKAPCSSSEGYVSFTSVPDRCGPMRRIDVPRETLERAAGQAPS